MSDRQQSEHPTTRDLTPGELLSAKEVAELTGYRMAHVYYLAKKGRLPAIHLEDDPDRAPGRRGANFKFRRADVLRLFKPVLVAASVDPVLEVAHV